jgi:AraC-like DNA-binding protein
MGDYLYNLFRGASGFALIVIGLTCFFDPRKERIRYTLGSIYTTSGLLFVYSALDPILHSEAYTVILVVAILFYFLGQGLFEMAYFFLGDNAHDDRVRRTYAVGLAWTLMLCVLPVLDRFFALGPAKKSIEDAHSMLPFHYLAYILSYAWPIVSTAWAWIGGFVRLPERGVNYAVSRGLLVLLTLVLASMLTGFVGFAVSEAAIYRAGNIMLQLSLISFFLYEMAHPHLLSRAREEIQEGRKRKNLLGDATEKRIKDGLEQLVAEGRILFESSVTLGRLAGLLGVSMHQLSYYFNTCLGTGFSAWHNKIKIDRARALLGRDEETSIIEIAFECGFGSKTVFNDQFKHIVGMTPSEFRRSIRKKGDEAARIGDAENHSR